MLQDAAKRDAFRRLLALEGIFFYHGHRAKDPSAGRAFFRPDERLRLDMGSLVKKIHRERQRTVLPAGLDAGEDGRKKEINEDSGI